MKRKINFYILIFCCLLYKGIVSSNLNIRKKRIVDRTTHGSTPLEIAQFPFIVNIQINNKSSCGGSILSSTKILTAAHCLRFHDQEYSVLSGSHYKNSGIRHRIIMKIIYPSVHRNSVYENDLAMLSISPPIDLVLSHNRRIELYNENLPPNAYGTFASWKCYRTIIMKIKLPRCGLTSINLPIISQQDCQIYYRNYYNVTSKNICTFDRNGELGCSSGDSGGPLVYHGKLLGVLSWTKDILHSPDIFMNVANPEYRNWIMSLL